MSTLDPVTASVEVPAAPMHPADVAVAAGPIRRVATLGFGLGLIGALLNAAVVLLTNALVQALYNLRETFILSALIICLPVLTLGLYILLLFYGLRLVTAGPGRRGTAPRTAAEMAKFRRVCGPLLVFQLLIVVLGQTEGLPLSLPFTALGILCAAGCAYTLLDSRRVAWDIALAQGAVFTPEHGIGFLVLSPSVGPPRLNGALPSAEGTITPVDVLPAAEAARAMSPSSGTASPVSAAADGSVYADWEKVLYGLVLLIVVMNLLDVPAFVRHVVDYGSADFWSKAWNEAGGGSAALARNRSVLGYGPGAVQAYATPADRWVRFFSLAGSAVSGAVSLCWVAWGVTCLAWGPKAREAIRRFAYLTIAIALLSGGLRLYAYESSVGRYYGTSGLTYSTFGGYVREWSGGRAGPFSSGRADEELVRDVRLDLFRQSAIGLALPVLLLLVVTREPVKALFIRRPRRSG